MDEDVDLLASCVTPLLAGVRTPNRAAQQTVIQALNADQGALFILWVLYTHARHGLSGFCREMPHRLASPGFWTLLTAGLKHIAADDLLAVVSRWQAVVEPALAVAGFDLRTSAFEPRLDQDAVVRVRQAIDLVDANAMAGLDEDYHRLVPGALHCMAD